MLSIFHTVLITLVAPSGIIEKDKGHIPKFAWTGRLSKAKRVCN